MMKPLLACLLLVVPAAANPETATGASGQWTVSGSAEGCIAHSTSGHGTVVSILGAPGQEDLVFLFQNNDWSALEDGGSYRLAVELDGRRSWEFDAVARTELDSDGPGFVFSVSPGAEFVTQFAAARGMEFGSEGETLDNLSLTGGDTAISGLANCMSSLIAGVADESEEGETLLASGVGKRI